jgi:uncharacterized phiE125 gp8 family phage protein
MAVNKLVHLTKVVSGTEPVSLADAKTYMRITSSSEDTLITSMIKASRMLLEKKLGISLIVQTITEKYSEVAETITLGYAPVNSVTSVSRFNSILLVSTNKTTLTLNTDYTVQGDVIMLDSTEYPIEVVYAAGYTSANIPDDLKQLILRQTSFMYDNRNMDSELEPQVKIMAKALTRNFF